MIPFVSFRMDDCTLGQWQLPVTPHFKNVSACPRPLACFTQTGVYGVTNTYARKQSTPSAFRVNLVASRRLTRNNASLPPSWSRHTRAPLRRSITRSCDAPSVMQREVTLRVPSRRNLLTAILRLQVMSTSVDEAAQLFEEGVQCIRGSPPPDSFVFFCCKVASTKSRCSFGAQATSWTPLWTRWARRCSFGALRPSCAPCERAWKLRLLVVVFATPEAATFACLRALATRSHAASLSDARPAAKTATDTGVISQGASVRRSGSGDGGHLLQVWLRAPV